MNAPVEVSSTGVDHTRSLAAALGELIRAGDILVVQGTARDLKEPRVWVPDSE